MIALRSRRQSLIASLRVAVALLVALATLPGCPRPARAGEHREPLEVAIAFGPGKGDLLRFREHLEKNYHVRCAVVTAEKARKNEGSREFQKTPVENIDALADCDVILSNFYRTWAPPEQLELLKETFRGKPVVGLRKAHHGFQNWLGADKEVFGVDYRGHYFGENVGLRIVDGHKDDPLFARLEKVFLPAGGLYKHVDVAEDVEVLMTGGPEGEEPMPQMWRRIVADREDQRVLYTRYDPRDLSDPGVREMVVRALFWAAEADPAEYRKR